MLIVASMQLVKGLLLLTVAIGALWLVGENVEMRVKHWIAMLGVETHTHAVRAVLAELARVNAEKLEKLSAWTFCYAAIMFLAGFGLLWRLRWGIPLTIVATAAFIPLEIRQLMRQLSGSMAGALLINVVVLVYLMIRIRRSIRTKRQPRARRRTQQVAQS